MHFIRVQCQLINKSIHLARKLQACQCFQNGSEEKNYLNPQRCFHDQLTRYMCALCDNVNVMYPLWQHTMDVLITRKMHKYKQRKDTERIEARGLSQTAALELFKINFVKKKGSQEKTEKSTSISWICKKGCASVPKRSIT